ncbi:polysaccharide biosynthesis/export family protein, partial [Elusimicrobiota bacterium]
ISLQVGTPSPETPEDAPPTAQKEKKVDKRLEEVALQSALQFLESQQHSYKISSADLLEITVYQEEDMTRRVRVSPKGIITFPLIGKVKVSGLGVAEAEQAITTMLKRYVIDPQISIFITEYGNKQVYVLGEVKNPGSYALPTEAPLSVLEAITLAGGFTQYASVDNTRVIRKSAGKSRTFPIEISAITKRGDKSKDLQLNPNDVIFVPESFF